MSDTKKVFDASHAPREEVEGVLRALEEAGFDVFEIRDSRLWGGGAICVREAEDREAARRVVEAFQENWRENARAARSDSRPSLPMIISVILILMIVLMVNLVFIL